MKERRRTGVRPPGAPSADPAIADKAEKKRRKQNRGCGVGSGSRQEPVYAILINHAGLIAKPIG